MEQQVSNQLQELDALPQPLGDYKPVDQWQAHINALFYGLRGDQQRSFYQTFATADYRLAHALAADYYDKVVARDTRQAEATATGQQTQPQPVLTVMEWSPGNGALAACFLSHLKQLDKNGTVYPRVRYVLVDS